MDTRTPIAALTLCALFVTTHCAPPSDSAPTTVTVADSAEHGERVWYRTVEIDGLDIFYREAGSKDTPAVLLLHGFPTSSHMFRNLMPALADEFYLVAPDYPGFGNSSQPPMEEFDYTFDRLAEIVEKFTEKVGIDRYSIYLMDYGAPIGFRLAAKHPERVDTLLVQNGNAYEEGLREFWDPIKKYWEERTPENAEPLTGFITPDGVKWQYTHGVRDPAAISPDNWNVDLQPSRARGESRDPTGALPQLREQPTALSGVAGLLPRAPTADTDCLGEERLHLPRGRSPSVQGGSAQPRVPLARHRALCTRGRWRRDRRADSGFPEKEPIRAAHWQLEERQVTC